MNVTTLIIGFVALFAFYVHAFPSITLKAAANGARCEKKRCPFSESRTKERRGAINTTVFDAETQLVDVCGQHAYVPPNFAAGDLRGPCPGLNALANHGYMPHNGWGTLTQYVEATNKVYGMSLDLGTTLSIIGTVLDGNPFSLNPGWSMGGPTNNTNLLGSLTGLLGTPQGISGSHNKYEADSSPTRGDLYQYGNDQLLQVSQFQALYDLQADADQPNYDLDVLLQHRKNRFRQSVSENPYFFYGPFTGIQASQAATIFIYRLFSSASAEHPEGILDREVLKSFFAITGQSGRFHYNPGWERIPENWYRRALGNEYSVLDFQNDVIDWASRSPELLGVGGNTGTVNSFTEVDISDLTGGVYNAKTLTEGYNLSCFTFQALEQGSADVLKGLFSDITAPLSMLTSQLEKLLAPLGCPQLKSIDTNQFHQFPGYNKSYDGYGAGVGL